MNTKHSAPQKNQQTNKIPRYITIHYQIYKLSIYPLWKLSRENIKQEKVWMGNFLLIDN